MSFTEAELDNLSTLARITITSEEKPKMLADIQAILGYISEINSVDAGGLTLEARGDAQERIFNIVREDVVTHGAGSNTDAILGEAPATKDGYVKVEQVLK